jgi:Na+/proline symporter
VGIVLWTAYDWGVTAMGMVGATLSAQGTLPADTEPDEVILRVLPHFLPVGLTGLFLGGVLAAAMSTIDSYLLISSGNVVYDGWTAVTGRRPDDARLVARTRWGVVACGALAALLALRFERIKEAWVFMAHIVTATALVPVLAALFGPTHPDDRDRPLVRRPLAGACASFGGLLSFVASYAVITGLGDRDDDLATWKLTIAGTEVLAEYALWVALPVSGLGYLVGRFTGRPR